MTESKIVNLYIPCQMDMFQSGTAYSALTVLERLGDLCQYFDEQTCCGCRFYLEGEIVYAKDLAIKIMDNCDKNIPFVIPDSTCAGYVKTQYKHLLKNAYTPTDLTNFSNNVRELCDYIVNVKQVESLGNYFPHKVFYFKSCSARNVYPANNAPETLLRNTRGLELLMDDDIHGCCGANGRFSKVNPSASEALTGEIISKIYSMGAEYITSTDIRCLQHLEAYKLAHGVDLEIMHIADILKGE
ncbi:MAG: (Fe-S)-binding protein [Bacteroidales bacterium]|nr:(Fe-S)-binding protein [Bacteroidales bacterium]